MFGDPKKRAASLVLAIHPPAAQAEETDGSEGLRACMRDLMECLKSGDDAGAADAFTSACQMVDAMPHEEGPHEDEGGDAA